MTWPNRDELFDSSDSNTAEASRPRFLSWFDATQKLPGGVPAESLQINNGTISPSVSFVRVDTEGQAPTDVLEKIAIENTHDGMVLFLSPALETRTIIAQNSSSLHGLRLTTGKNITLENNTWLIVRRNGDYWEQISFADLGGRFPDVSSDLVGQLLALVPQGNGMFTWKSAIPPVATTSATGTVVLGTSEEAIAGAHATKVVTVKALADVLVKIGATIFRRSVMFESSGTWTAPEDCVALVAAQGGGGGGGGGGGTSYGVGGRGGNGSEGHTFEIIRNVTKGTVITITIGSGGGGGGGASGANGVSAGSGSQIGGAPGLQGVHYGVREGTSMGSNGFGSASGGGGGGASGGYTTVAIGGVIVMHAQGGTGGGGGGGARGYDINHRYDGIPGGAGNMGGYGAPGVSGSYGGHGGAESGAGAGGRGGLGSIGNPIANGGAAQTAGTAGTAGKVTIYY